MFNGKIHYLDWAIFNSKLLVYQRVNIPWFSLAFNHPCGARFRWPIRGIFIRVLRCFGRRRRDVMLRGKTAGLHIFLWCMRFVQEIRIKQKISFAIENDHRNSGFSHLNMVIFRSDVNVYQRVGFALWLDCWLVVVKKNILKNMSSSMGRLTTHIWNWKITNVWNHQPECIGTIEHILKLSTY